MEDSTCIYFKGPEESRARAICEEMFGDCVKDAEFLSADLGKKVLVYETTGGETQKITGLTTEVDRTFVVAPQGYLDDRDFKSGFSTESLQSDGMEFRAALVDAYIDGKNRGVAIIYAGDSRDYMPTLYRALLSRGVQAIEVNSDLGLAECLGHVKDPDLVFIDIVHSDVALKAKNMFPASYVALLSPGIRNKWPKDVDVLLPYSEATNFGRLIEQTLNAQVKGSSRGTKTNSDHTGAVYFMHGPTAAGKSTLIRRGSEAGLVEEVIRSTDRPARLLEERGKDYQFLTEKEFSKREDEGRFFFVHEGWHGTHRYAFPEFMLRYVREGKDCACQVKRTNVVPKVRKVLQSKLGRDPKIVSVLVHAKPKDLAARIFELSSAFSSDTSFHERDALEDYNARLQALKKEAGQCYDERNNFDYFIDTSKWDINEAFRVFENIVMHERTSGGRSFEAVVLQSLFGDKTLDEILDGGFARMLSIPREIIIDYAKGIYSEDVSGEDLRALARTLRKTIKHIYRTPNQLAVFFNNGWTPEECQRHPRDIALDIIERAIPYKSIRRNPSEVFDRNSPFLRVTAERGSINDGLLYCISDFVDKGTAIYQIYFGFLKRDTDEEGKPISDPRLTVIT